MFYTNHALYIRITWDMYSWIAGAIILDDTLHSSTKFLLKAFDAEKLNFVIFDAAFLTSLICMDKYT